MAARAPPVEAAAGRRDRSFPESPAAGSGRSDRLGGWHLRSVEIRRAGKRLGVHVPLAHDGLQVRVLPRRGHA
jgi:hypothetical protein